MPATALEDRGNLIAESSSVPSLHHKGLVRVQTILQHIDCSATTWWRWVKKGIAPQPITIDGGGTYWKTEDIIYFIENGKAK